MGSGGLTVMDEDNCTVDIIIISFIRLFVNYQIVISVLSISIYGRSIKKWLCICAKPSLFISNTFFLIHTAR